MIGLRLPSGPLAPPMPRRWSLTDTMTTRSAALITIGLIAILLAVVALAALFAGDISERTGGIVSSVLGSFATVLAGLLLFLRVETVSSKVDSVDNKVDDAAEKADLAARKAASAESKVEQVHHDVLNGPMRATVKRAIAEAEADPAVVERRIEITAKGVQHDRHETASREQAAYARGVQDAMRRQQERQGGKPS